VLALVVSYSVTHLPLPDLNRLAFKGGTSSGLDSLGDQGQAFTGTSYYAASDWERVEQPPGKLPTQ
jgi:hypothetical protein